MDQIWSKKPLSRGKKIKRVISWGLLLLVIGLIAYNLIRYPIQGDLYWMLGVEPDDITGAAINHYGQTVEIGEGEELDDLVSLFDAHLTRGASDYIFHTTGGDWGISFMTRDGGQTPFFAFYPAYPTDTQRSSKIHMRHYYYTCEETLYIDLVKACWEKYRDTE